MQTSNTGTRPAPLLGEVGLVLFQHRCWGKCIWYSSSTVVGGSVFGTLPAPILKAASNVKDLIEARGETRPAAVPGAKN